jgi:glycosyltransferase involved in cell wall biosynthesis
VNVLIVCAWDNLGGVCGVVNQVAARMRDDGHRVWLLNPGDHNWPVEGESRLGFPAFRIRLRPTFRSKAPLKSLAAFVVRLPFTLFALGWLLVRHRIDVVNLHYPTGALSYFAILRHLGLRKLVTSLHGADLLPNGVRNPEAPVGLHAVLGASDLFVVPSESFKKSVITAWPEIAGKPIVTIPNGIDAAELGYDKTLQDTATDPPYLMSITLMVYYKGADVLIRAFAKVADEFPALRLMLVSDGPNRAEFEALATSLGVRHRVDFPGILDRPSVAKALRGCTVFVLPSRSSSESFGIAAAEAMALDRPVIVSSVGGLPELVEHEVTGLLVPPGDPDSLADAIRRLMHDPALRVRLGRSAGTRVRRDLPWERTGTLYRLALTGVTGHAAPPTTNTDAST